MPTLQKRWILTPGGAGRNIMLSRDEAGRFLTKIMDRIWRFAENPNMGIDIASGNTPKNPVTTGFSFRTSDKP